MLECTINSPLNRKLRVRQLGDQIQKSVFMKVVSMRTDRVAGELAERSLNHQTLQPVTLTWGKRPRRRKRNQKKGEFSVQHVRRRNLMLD
jgi:hypothetical protein